MGSALVILFVILSALLVGLIIGVIGFYLNSTRIRHVAAAALSTAITACITATSMVSGHCSTIQHWQFWGRWVAISLMIYAVVTIIKIRWLETNGKEKHS